MAKRKEVILQEVLNTQEAWDEAMGKQNLYVVDAHQKWCGPCTAIVGMLKRIKNELGDDLLKFATAEVDSIDSLEQYRGKCEPNFLFFGSGELVAAVRGCNAPLIQNTITSTLEAEHKVINGEIHRKVIRDSYTGSPEQDEPEADEEEEKEDDGVVPKHVTVALIKPDVVQNGQVDEIIQKIKDAGIEILVNDEHTLTEEEACEFYKSKSEESYFDDLVKYVTSGPCRVLVLTKGDTGEGVVELWRNIIGPFDAAVAKEESPQSLRSIYGENATKNALHGSSSEEEAVRELGFFYPNFRPPTFHSSKSLQGSRAPSSKKHSKHPSAAGSQGRLQRTLAIIRPDALKQHKDAIMQKITEAGFTIAMEKEVTLTTEQAEEFYQEHKGQDYFEPLVKQMTGGPVLALCLAHTDAVNRWRQMLGPKVVAEAIENEPDSLRAQFGEPHSEINMLHGSDTADTAEAELAKIFQVEQTLAVIKPDGMSEKEKILAKLKEAGFMISCQRDMSLSKEIASEIYKSKEGAEFYDDLIDHMTSGDTLMMVLSAENAVEKLRDLTGPTDPEEAKNTNPNSLRALFAKSILENAVHSPSSKDSADEQIRIVFGDEAHFEWDGSPKTSAEQLNVENEEDVFADADEAGGKKEEEEEDKKEEEAAADDAAVAEAGAESTVEGEAPAQEEAAEPEEGGEEKKDDEEGVEKQEEQQKDEDAELAAVDEPGKRESDRDSVSSSNKEGALEVTGEGSTEITQEAAELSEADQNLDTEDVASGSKSNSRPASTTSGSPKPPSPGNRSPPHSRSSSRSSSGNMPSHVTDKPSKTEQNNEAQLEQE